MVFHITPNGNINPLINHEKDLNWNCYVDECGNVRICAKHDGISRTIAVVTAEGRLHRIKLINGVCPPLRPDENGYIPMGEDLSNPPPV